MDFLLSKAYHSGYSTNGIHATCNHQRVILWETLTRNTRNSRKSHFLLSSFKTGCDGNKMDLIMHGVWDNCDKDTSACFSMTSMIQGCMVNFFFQLWHYSLHFTESNILSIRFHSSFFICIIILSKCNACQF